MKKGRLNKSEEIILKIIRGEIPDCTKRYRKTKDGEYYFYRLTMYDNAIDSLKKKGLIYIDKDNVLKEKR